MPARKPFNVKLLSVSKAELKNIPEVKVMDVYYGATDQLHPDGLFSTELFGLKGENRRNEQLAYTHLKAEVLHPIIHDAFARLKGLYKGIMDGTEYAVWDAKEKDFVRSNEIDGDTGYAFFINKFEQIELKRTGSAERDDRIQLIKDNLTRALVSNLVIMPAGLRDIEVDATGRVKKDEINKKYQRVLSIVNMIGSDTKSSAQDNTRRSLQKVFNEIYLYIKDMLDGKSGFMLSKWASRTVYNGTGNVIVSKKRSREALDANNTARTNDTGVGLFQTLKGTLPVAKYYIKKYMESRFVGLDGQARVINKKTLKSELADISTDDVDLWTTGEGIERLINRFKDDDVRHLPVTIGNYYAFLVYQDDKVFKVFNDIGELPEGFDKTKVRPMSLIELFYLCNYQGWYTYRGWMTRFPVTGSESVYPSNIYVHTTLKALTLTELDADWKPIDGAVALEFPISGEHFMDALIPDTTRLAGLGAD